MDAERFLAQLRAQTYADRGIALPRFDSADQELAIDWMHSGAFPRERLQPSRARELGDAAQLSGRTYDDIASQFLNRIQNNIEKTAAARIDGMDVTLRRPLIGHLFTGQLNAVSMRVPGNSRAYLVLLEDQMTLFAGRFSETIALAVSHSPFDSSDKVHFSLSLSQAAERIEDDLSIAERFAEVVVDYATTGSIEGSGQHRTLLPSSSYALLLQTSLFYFVVGHEYAHVIMGHLEETPTRKGVLPAADVETLEYSWLQEVNADYIGTILAINAGVEHANSDVVGGFLGICLFFDALDVMDRAVALLQTGDENSRQLGSHPPAYLRKQLLCEKLPHTFGNAPGVAENVQKALQVADIQGEIIRLLWGYTKPVLRDLRRRGVPVASTWRTIPKESGEDLPL